VRYFFISFLYLLLFQVFSRVKYNFYSCFDETFAKKNSVKIYYASGISKKAKIPKLNMRFFPL
jgi:hypothetical protein